MKDLKKESGTKRKTASTGKSYVFVSYLFVGLFLVMIVYMAYFQVVKSKELLNSPYNTRQEAKAEYTVKGSLLSRAGEVLAETQTDEEGNEYRVYPYGNYFAQVVGYSDYGSSGLEATQNYLLMESHENILDQFEKDINEQKKYGDNVVTTLDTDYQVIAYNALAGRKGSVIILDADTADVLACVSQPDFNPTTVSEDWEVLNLEESGSPFLNRALQGLYEPGSTFKIVTALAFIRDNPDYQNFTFECTGEYTAGSYTIHCNNGAVHGTQTLADAFANSCNCAFAYIATQCLEETTLNETANSLKFNTDFSIGLPSAISSFKLEKTSSDGLTMQTAIGQGETVASPMMMAMIAQAIYNDGKMLQPSFVDKVVSHDGTVYSTENTVTVGQVMTSSEAQVLKNMMKCVAMYGTGAILSDLTCDPAGKTGTAEYGDGTYCHSWFTGFSNSGSSDIVVCVMIEEAEQGTSPAVETAYNIFAQIKG